MEVNGLRFYQIVILLKKPYVSLFLLFKNFVHNNRTNRHADKSNKERCSVKSEWCFIVCEKIENIGHHRGTDNGSNADDACQCTL